MISCLCACVRTCASAYACVYVRMRECMCVYTASCQILCEISFPLYVGSRDWLQFPRLLQQASLPSEPSCWPLLGFWRQGLTLWPWLGSNSWRCLCLNLPSDGVTDMHHHTPCGNSFPIRFLLNSLYLFCEMSLCRAAVVIPNNVSLQTGRRGTSSGWQLPTCATLGTRLLAWLLELEINLRVKRACGNSREITFLA